MCEAEWQSTSTAPLEADMVKFAVHIFRVLPEIR
jgi:hypothetical protein